MTSFGEARKWIASERDGSGQMVHYRGHTQACAPIVEDVKRRAQVPGGGELKYEGSIPRAMLVDWLQRRGKSMGDYARDNDLRRAFVLFMTAERPHFFAKSHV